ncbi:TM2 domain-containing protein [Prevotella communis]|uniref:TM2 domain-containing protein n=1 Tax=Prevotella communis TaxID=2913614 RepID=UPI001EDA3D8C|nr:TM2 domain-containing protein [Prevotella communis]UKK69054.1 TM2 domain-containing protein [Prevotella communis]UKK71469.1 TM2 domain-containing protein [Prevotella communis]
MTQEQIEKILTANKEKIATDSFDKIRERLANVDEGAGESAFSNLKSPTTAFLLSIISISFGWDRLYLGDIGLAILKFCTCGGCLIWGVTDWFTVKDRTKKINAKKILNSFM